MNHLALNYHKSYSYILMFYNDIQCLRIFSRSLYTQNINTIQLRRNIDIQMNSTFTLAFHRVLIHTSSCTTIQSNTIR